MKRLVGIALFGLMTPLAYGATNLPPELASAIRTAVIHHPDVAIAKSEVLGAKATVAAGEYRWYPKVEVSSRAGTSQAGGAGNRSLNLGLKQALWDAGRVDAEFDSAKASESVSLFAEDATLEGVATRASNAYFNVLRAREQRQVAARSVDDHRALYNSISRRVDGGLGSRSDVTLISSRLQQAKAAEVEWQGEINRAEATYFSVINEKSPAAMSGIDVWEVDGGLQAAIESAKTHAPILKKLRNEVLVAEATVKSKTAQQYPTLYARVDHTNYLGGSTNSFYENDTRFTINFEWQNDVALTQRFQVEAAEQKVIAAKYAVDAAERQLVETLTNYWQEFITSRLRSDELKKYEKSSADTVAMFRKQFTLGRRTWPEVVNSLQDLFNAQNQQVDAKYQTMAARMKLAFLIGEMDQYIPMVNADEQNSQTVSAGNHAVTQEAVIGNPVIAKDVKKTTPPELAVDPLGKKPSTESAAAPKPVAISLASQVTTQTSSSLAKIKPLSEPVVPVNQEGAVIAAIKKWGQAWSSRNVEDYLACYATDVSSLNGEPLAQWKNKRRHELAGKVLNKIELSNLKILESGNEATASFKQIYSANGNIVRANKTMTLRNYDGHWLIVKEQVNP